MTFKEILSLEIVSSESLTLSVYSVLIVLIIILTTVFALRFVKAIFKKLIAKKVLEQGASWSIFLIVKYFIWVIITIVTLDTIGIQVSILLASVAALLVGVGLGIQQLFNDLASGIIILVERSLKIGDVIHLDDGTVGRVVSIGLRTSMVKSRDDIIMIIPNSKFVNEKIINWSHLDKTTRFNVNVGVAYGSDVLKVEQALLKCAADNKEIVSKPKPFVRFLNFGDSSLDFQLFFWTAQTFEVENLKSTIRFAINAEFIKQGIQIPFPQRDVHIKK
jgi:small-conductance mechanosensitive channel